MNWSDFFHMGGYAVYVWVSWGVTLLVLLWQCIQPKRKNAIIKDDIRRQIKRETKLQTNEANN